MTLSNDFEHLSPLRKISDIEHTFVPSEDQFNDSSINFYEENHFNRKERIDSEDFPIGVFSNKNKYNDLFYGDAITCPIKDTFEPSNNISQFQVQSTNPQLMQVDVNSKELFIVIRKQGDQQTLKDKRADQAQQNFPEQSNR